METSDADTILIVDDEESIRRTFREWLAGPHETILVAGDAESALKLANQHPIDLAILDWNLGAGDDGLHLLQDLVVFHPDIVAILVTGYANQATPLDAMRMGVRDYLDKNHDLSRDTFLRAVKKQLDRIRPAKQARRLQRSLAEFRASIEKTLPLVQSASALTDPIQLPDVVRRLVRFTVQTTQAKDGVLLVRHYDPARTPPEWCRAYDVAGAEVATGETPFARSLAGAAISRDSASIMDLLGKARDGISLYPFEEGRASVLVAPMAIGTGIHAVLELFDKPGGWKSDDPRLAQAAADLGAELIRHALGQSSQQRMLVDALGAALEASDRIASSLGPAKSEEAPPTEVLDRLRQGLATAAGDPALAQASVELAEAIRVLGHKHGIPALRHCRRLVDDLRELLDGITG